MNLVQKLASHLTLANDLSPDRRDREYKGRIRQCFAAFGQKPLKSVGASILGSIFLVPMLVLFVFLLKQDLDAILAEVSIYKDMGLIYGSSSPADVNFYIKQYYDKMQQYLLYYLVPCCLLGGIGMAGVNNAIRNLLWNTNPKLFRDFFVGIKRHWYKYMTTWTILGGLVLGFMWSLLELVECYYKGVSCNAGVWVMAIVFGLLSILAIMYSLVLHGMFVTHKYSDNAAQNMKDTLKNSAILAVLSPLQILIIIIGLCAPFSLCFFGMAEVALVCLALGGVGFYPMVSIQYSLYLSDNFTYFLYSRQQAQIKKANEKAINKEKKAKKGKKKK